MQPDSPPRVRDAGCCDKPIPGLFLCSSRRVSSSQVGVVFVFQNESFSHRSESSWCFTASLFFAGRSRLRFSRRVSSSHVGIVCVFHGECLPQRSDSYTCFTPNLFLAGRNRLRVSRRVCFLQVDSNLERSPLLPGESAPRRSVPSRWFMARLFRAGRN